MSRRERREGRQIWKDDESTNGRLEFRKKR